MAFSPDGSRVVTRTIKDGTVRFWDAKTGQELATLDVPPGYESQPVALTNSSLLVACSNVVRVWDVRPRAAPVELKGHDAHVDILAISGDGSQVITGSQDPIARVWDAGTGRPIALLRGHKGEVHSVGLSADGFRAVTGSSDRTARVWDARTGQTISELKGHTDTVTSVALSADGARVVTGSSDGTARVWDAHTGQTLAVLKGHPKGVRSVAIAGDASRVVTCSYGSTVVWDALTGTPTPNKLEGHDGWGRLAALSADGNRVMIWDLAGLAREWDTTTGRRLPEEPVPSPCPGGDYRQHEGAFVRTPDGRFTFASVGGRVRRVPTDVDALERAERLWLTRPDPDWNARRATDLVKENNDFGAAFQWAAERRAQGVLAFEAGDLDQAHSYFLHAALLTGVPPQRFIGGDGTGSTGLLAELFDGVGFDRRVRERRDDLLRWPLPGRGVTADPSLGPEQFSIRWTGWLRAPVPGLYGLEFAADDGVRVWIDGKQVIDAWKSPQVATHKRNIELTGIPQEIKIEYFQDRGGAGYDFRWVPPGATEAVRIPPSVLSPPRRPTAAPPPREVIRRIPFAVP